MIENLKEQFVMIFVNEMCECILENMEYDINLKKLSVKFYYKCQFKMINFGNFDVLYASIVKNINILSTYENTKPVLTYLLGKVSQDRIK